MRFLIIFAAAVAYASAAPSHLLPYAAYTAIPAIPIGALRTVSSGDIQAAAIDAQVKAADLAQEAVDKARLLSEQTAENLNTQAYSSVDQDKERLTSGFWEIEDKKWQALDALKTAEAQIDGAFASKADILAKTAVGAPYVAAVAPVAPVVYSGYAAPTLKSFSSQTLIQSHPEAIKAEGESEKIEAAVKAAEPAKEAEAVKEKSIESDSAAVEAAAVATAELKSEADKAFGALHAGVISPVGLAGALPYNAAYSYNAGYPYSGLAVASGLAPTVALAQPGFKYASTIQNVGPYATSILAQPGFKYASTIQHVGPYATSAFLKSQW